MASSSKLKKIYDVFLSFRGVDVRNNFISHLYTALKEKGIYTYVDSVELRKGERISLGLMKAIEESFIAVIVFSEDFASSSWCLEEVAKIMDCREKMDLIVLPVFYKVEPKEVRGPGKKYKEDMFKHEPEFRMNVEKWKQALCHAAGLSGWHLEDGNESKLVQDIVKEISSRLEQRPLRVAKQPVGINSQLDKMKSILNLESNDDAPMLGIWGPGGIGKTTLAKAIYNAIFRQFEGSSFLENVRETSKDSKDLATLQEKLLSDILIPQERLVVSNVDRGINLLRNRFCCKKVLLVLDDVNDLCQLNALAGERDWFGNGSRIIITTRDSHLLTCHGINEDHVCEVKELDYSESHELFTKHAFWRCDKPEIRKDLVHHVLNYAKGLPLALEVLGSFLCGRRENEWESTLKKLSRIPNRTINDMLKISYDALEENEKEIFLDISCFFNGSHIEHTKKVLNRCGFEATIGLEILIERCLIRIDHGILQMHNLIQLMGMDIVNQQYRNDPRRRSRLWLYEDVCDVLSNEMGDCDAKAIVLKSDEPKEICIGSNAFENMKKLRLLIVHNVHNTFQGPITPPSELRWFEWLGGPTSFSEFSFGPKKLVGLDTCEGSISAQPKQFKDFQNLNHMNLNYCETLICMPDISWTPNLEELHLQNCKALVEAHKSIAYHDKLEVLNLSGCSKLSVFPNVLKSKNLRALYLDGCLKFEKFPDIPHKLEGLKELWLQRTAIAELPASLENLVSLERMYLHNCKNLKSLPSNIYKLQNIEDLGLGGCTNLIKFPKYEHSINPCMRTGLSNLRWLSLMGCNMFKIEFMEHLSCSPFLRQLHLSTNNISGLPSSINKSDLSSELVVANCHRLQEPELPTIPNDPLVDNCESLQTNGDLTSFHDFLLGGLTMADIYSLGQIPPDLRIILPGGEMPEWVLPIEDRSICFMASKDLYDEFLGLALCVVLSNDELEKGLSLKIEPQVNGEVRDYNEYNVHSLDSDHIWLQYVIPYKLWGVVDFGQIGGTCVQFRLTISSRNVKMWGFRMICKQLGDSLKVALQDNRLIDPNLLYEVVPESTYSEAECSFMHEDCRSRIDLQKDLRDCQMSTNQGMCTLVQPLEFPLPTNSGEQTNPRTSGVSDSAADEPKPPEPINDLSAIGSGTASTWMSTTMSTASAASMPFQGAAQLVDLPSAQLFTEAEESTSEVSDIEMSDLEAIDEILGVGKPRRERPLPSGSDSSTSGAVDRVRAKWEEWYQLTKEGYFQIVSNLSVEDRIKNLLAELSSGNACFTKTPEFQYDFEEFAMCFANGVEVFRQNCDKIELSKAVEESFNKLVDRLETGKKILEERRSSFRAAEKKKAELTGEKKRLEELLAEVERRIEHNNIHIRREGRSTKQQLSEVKATMRECDRRRAEVGRHLSIRRNRMEDNKYLDERLSTFRRTVQKQLDEM